VGIWNAGWPVAGERGDVGHRADRRVWHRRTSATRRARLADLAVGPDRLALVTDASTHGVPHLVGSGSYLRLDRRRADAGSHRRGSLVVRRPDPGLGIRGSMVRLVESRFTTESSSEP